MALHEAPGVFMHGLIRMYLDFGPVDLKFWFMSGLASYKRTWVLYGFVKNVVYHHQYGIHMSGPGGKWPQACNSPYLSRREYALKARAVAHVLFFGYMVLI